VHFMSVERYPEVREQQNQSRREGIPKTREDFPYGDARFAGICAQGKILLKSALFVK